jgi:hypothetical protein
VFLAFFSTDFAAIVVADLQLINKEHKIKLIKVLMGNAVNCFKGSLLFPIY